MMAYHTPELDGRVAYAELSNAYRDGQSADRAIISDPLIRNPCQPVVSSIDRAPRRWLVPHNHRNPARNYFNARPFRQK
jgi:hypothetical protein